MPRSKDAYERMRTEAQSKIMDTAITLFSKKGFSGTSINDIAEAANISGGLIYRYFKSKQDLFDRIIDMAVDGLHVVTQLAGLSSTPKETFEIICQEMIDSLDDEQYIKLSSMIVQGLISQDSPAFTKLLSADKKMMGVLADLIKKGQKQKTFRQGDSMAKACLFISAVQGMTLMKVAFKEEFRPPTVADMMSFLLKGENDGNNN